jgi:hypothetical protein
MTTLLFREYAPGLLTAMCLSLPITGYFMVRVWLEQRLTKAEFAAALLLGTVMAAAAIGVLFLH